MILSDRVARVLQNFNFHAATSTTRGVSLIDRLQDDYQKTLKGT